MSKRKEGKKGGKKIGRASRKPSHNRYNLEGRRAINKARKQAKIAKMLEKKRLRKERKDGLNRKVSDRGKTAKTD